MISAWLSSGRWLVLLAVLAALLAWDGLRTSHYRELGRQDILVPQRKAALLARQAAEDKETHWQNKLRKENQDAQQRYKSLQMATAASLAADNGLRNEVRSARSRLPTLARETLDQYADTGTELLLECSRTYQELAVKADGHASDQQTLEQGWPQ